MSHADIVMFTLDRQIDRRIMLAAGTMRDAGLSVRLFAPAEGALEGEPDWITRIGARPTAGVQPASVRLSGAQYDGPSFLAAGLGVYRFLRDRLPFLRGFMRLAVRTLAGGPERPYPLLFRGAIEKAPARLYIAHDLPMLPVALAARERHGGKVIFDSHELFPEQEFSAHEQKAWRRVEARHIGKADAVITVNASIGRELARRHGIADPVIVHNAERRDGAPVREERNRLRAALSLPADVPVLLYQGGLAPSRNLDMLVMALARLRRQTTALVFLGDGAAKPVLEATTRRLNLCSRVFFHPAVPQASLLSLTQGADFGIIPYQTNCLNNELCTPNKLFEFIMAGVPVIATDLREIRGIVTGYGMGVVGDTSTPEAFARLIDGALDSAAARKGEWAAGLQRASRELCWEREGEKYLAVVRALLAPKTHGPAFDESMP
ncbi:glycosyltransferase [Shinella zoogloeoides]|uniref:Glycosyltransferase n=1 Tax=Shinella zoogloeoides TaxID=352475 RepID=A0A6N8TJX2_SHIZO|nr:glycosyltransferase [Shinella zoogloeoides]MXO02725.1 glycosyltransferase [Shinella zoogloeoides]UEX81825.1 glycosyltransferase [Shinella zoogloeoides]